MIVTKKRRQKVNVQRPCVAISLGQQIKQGKVKAQEPTAMPTDADHVVNPMRNANNMAKLSHMVGFYDKLAAHQAYEANKPEPSAPQNDSEKTGTPPDA